MASIQTIPSGAPFLETLVDALLDGRLVEGFAPRGDPLALASATLYLPTRRSVRALRLIFLDRLGGEAAILPRLLALGEVDEDEAAFDIGSAAADMPEAIAPLERQLGLTRLILGWSRAIKGALLPLPGEDEPLLIPSSPGDAAGLARDLARFIDGLQIDRVPFEALGRLTAEHEGRYARYWDLTLRFLAIAGDQWPAHLAEIGRIEPAERRNRLLAAEAERIAAGKMAGPVIVAGSTGSVPATRDLIAAIAASPRGAVVLPGLDRALDPVGWAAITDGEGSPGHPQAALKTLIAALGRPDRADIAALGTVAPELADRARLVSDALRPAATTELWQRTDRFDDARITQAFADVAVIEAAHEGEEGLAIALALRETLETPDRRAALVTPDRGLAARVVCELSRWGIAADDSAGRTLIETPPGILMRLVLDVALDDFAPIPVLALLKHPFATLGLTRGAVRRATEALEIGALRGPQPPPGLAGLRRTLAVGKAGVTERHASPARRALTDADWQAAGDMLDRLEQSVGPLREALHTAGAIAAARLFAVHVDAIEAVCAAYPSLYAFEAGSGLAAFLSDLLAVPADALDLPAAEYPGLFAALAADRSVRGNEPKHPRLAIYGLLEARLLAVDRIVLGGLDEGVWPPEPRIDPWLNRPMRTALGLSAPEKRVGLAAHDFEQALGIGDVVVTRALKRGRSPTVPSRWLQRLQASLGEPYRSLVERGAVWRDLARRIDAPSRPIAVPRAPRPRPPLALRPTSLSVTRVEDLVRDPYTIYARHILKLRPLDAIALAPGAADRGTLIHEALRRFAEICRDGVPADAEAQLVAIGDDLFDDFADYPDVQAFWRPRFAHIATFLAGWEAERRPRLAAVATEIAGRIGWPTVAGRSFTLTAQADRIESGADGSVRVLDFKTGAAPSARQVQSGMSPQLALETAMLAEAGFPVAGVAPGTVGAPMLVRLGAGRDACKAIEMAFDGETPMEVAERSLASLKALIDRFESEATPYVSLVHPMFKGRRYGDYDHLARVREWSLASEEAGE